MSAAYRRKLLNWLTSMLVLAFTTVFSLLHEWALVPMFMGQDFLDADRVLLGVGQATGAFFVLFFPLWIWHMADFCQQGTVNNRVSHVLSSYRLFLALVMLLAGSLLLQQTTWLNDLGCPEPETVRVPEMGTTFGFLDGCGAWTPWWKEVISITSFLAVLAVALGKIILSLASIAMALRNWALSRREGMPTAEQRHAL